MARVFRYEDGLADADRSSRSSTLSAHCPGSAVRRGKAVRDLLARLYSDGTRVAIAFDEIHRLNDSALSSLKNFLEMSSGGFQRYLGVIMLGQPQFEARLRDHVFARSSSVSSRCGCPISPARPRISRHRLISSASRPASFSTKMRST
jgi:hypothetical protein